jgi:hypothetical protein
MGEKETGAADEAERLKTKTKSNQSNDRMDQGGAAASGTGVTNDPETTWEPGNLAGGVGGAGDAPEAAINTSHSNIKNLREGGGISHEDDWHDSGKLAPEKPGKSEIAIGDPGVNGNITGDTPDIAIGEPGWNTGIAVTDEGVPAEKPAPKSN